jgi:preprotein translocase subunit SecE
MTEQVQDGASPLDAVKLVAAAGIVAAGIAAFYYFGNLPIWLRWIIVLATLAGGALVSLQSSQGRQFWQFVQSSRVELRKIVWPNRQETLQVTLLVFVMVTVMGLFFWALDLSLGSLTRWLTGQGG